MRLQEILLVSALVFSQSALNSAFADTANDFSAEEKTSVPTEESSSQSVSLSEKEQKQKNAELIKAIVDNNIGDVQILLKEGADANARGNKKSALKIAIDLDNIGIAESLVEAGAENEGAALIEAIKSKDVKAVQELLKIGADPDARGTEEFKTALIVAIEGGSPEIVDLLIKAKAKITHHYVPGFYFGSPLEAAIEKGNPEVLDRVLKAKANEGIKDEEVMREALDLETLNLEVIRVLISNKITSFGGVGSSKLIGRAMERNSPEAVEMLLKVSDAYFNTKIIFDYGEDLLVKAARIGNTKIMELMLDATVLNSESKSKFQKFIFNMKYPFSNPVVNGRSALIYSVELGNADGVKLLLDRGADPNIKVQDESLRDYAQRRGQTEIVEILDSKSSALSSACKRAFQWILN